MAAETLRVPRLQHVNFFEAGDKIFALFAGGVGRLFLQPRTWDKGSKTGVPSVRPKASYIRDPDTGNLLEAELGAGGSSEVLPQLLIVNAGQIAVTGRDAGTAAAFLSELQKSLSDDVTLIEKTRDGFEVAYQTTPLIWKDDAYAPGRAATHARPPKTGLWMEPLIRPETAQDGEAWLPRIFRRPAGQLVCRADAAEHAAFFLTVLRNAPELLDISKVGAAGMAQSPSWIPSGVPDRHVRSRSGADQDTVELGRKAPRTGPDPETRLRCRRNVCARGQRGRAQAPAGNLGAVDRYAGSGASRPPQLVASAYSASQRRLWTRADGALYGGPAEVIELAEFKEPIAELRRPIVLLVDYVKRKGGACASIDFRRSDAGMPQRR